MYSPKVSIIVPVYNVSQYIVTCLDSILEQTYDNIELIIVDDCGSDNSMMLVREFQSKHPSLDLHIISHERNRGLSAARNSGLLESNGEYVYFLDSDDFITKDCIKLLTNPLKIKAWDIVVGNYTVVGSETDISDLKMHSGQIEGNEAVLSSYANGLWYVMAWNKLCRRDFLLANNLMFEEGLLHEDVIWSFKLACKAQSMFIVEDVTYNYLFRKSSIMTSMSIEKDVSVYLQAFGKVVDFIVNENRTHGKYEYKIVEGKICGILYSLLQKDEMSLYNKYYPEFSRLSYISPIEAYKKHIISLGYLFRDFHRCLPVTLGALYKRLFFNLLYAWRGKKIEGAVWS